MQAGVGNVESLFHYPIKGLSGQPLSTVSLADGEGFPWDRAFALARPEGKFDPAHTVPLDKSEFYMLMRNERLAGLTTHYEPTSGYLTISVGGHQVLRENIDRPAGADALNGLIARVLDLPETRMPSLARQDAHRFTDVSVVSPQMMRAVSIINLESVADFAERIGRPIHPMRFRGNIYVSSLPAWSELDLLGQEIFIGSVRMRIEMHTKRCAATEVDPQTARRDIPVPRLLMQHYGHAKMGIYGVVVAGGTLGLGDIMEPIAT